MTLNLVRWQSTEPLILQNVEGSAPAGFPSPADDYLETPLDLNEYLVQNKPATFLMRVQGDSMKDAGILDGDLLVVDRSVKPSSGSIVVAAIAGEFTVKRLRYTASDVRLEPANSDYKVLHVSDGDDLHIFGVVRHAIHTLR